MWINGGVVAALHDYMGEPGAWPHVSSSFGAIDLAGFPTPPAWFYRPKASTLLFFTPPPPPPLIEAFMQLRALTLLPSLFVLSFSLSL